MHWQLAHNGVPLVTGQCDLGAITYRRIGDVTWQPQKHFEDAAGLDALLDLAAPAGIEDLALVQLNGETASFEGTNTSVANLDGSTCTYDFDEGTWQTYCTEQLTNMPFPAASFDTAKMAGILATMRADAAAHGGIDHDQSSWAGWTPFSPMWSGPSPATRRASSTASTASGCSRAAAPAASGGAGAVHVSDVAFLT